MWGKLEKGEIKTIADLYKERCKSFFKIYNIDESIDKFNSFLIIYLKDWKKRINPKC